MNTIDLFSLRYKTAVVVGGEGFLGKLICETVRELDGYAVSADLKPTADYPLDLLDELNCQELASEVQHCDILVNAAVGNQLPTLYRMGGWAEDLHKGLTLAANTMWAFQGHLKEAKGVVLNIGSDLGLMAPYPDRYGDQYKPLSYPVVKHGLIGLTRAHAALWGKDGVRVNCLCPGSINQGQAVPNCPLGRLASLEEMKGPIAFMVSPASSYMTGAVVSVDGGSTIW